MIVQCLGVFESAFPSPDVDTVWDKIEVSTSAANAKVLHVYTVWDGIVASPSAAKVLALPLSY